MFYSFWQELQLDPPDNFDRGKCEDLLKRRFFYAPAFEIYGGKLLKWRDDQLFYILNWSNWTKFTYAITRKSPNFTNYDSKWYQSELCMKTRHKDPCENLEKLLHGFSWYNVRWAKYSKDIFEFLHSLHYPCQCWEYWKKN